MAELNADIIARTALAMIDEHGETAFTIRAVAERLGVTPMALYHHVPDKAALAVLVVDAAVGEYKLTRKTDDWRAALLALARSVRKGSQAHPAIAHIRRQYRVWTPAMLRVTEHWLNLWRQSGLSPKKAMLAATTSSLAIHGLVNEEVLLSEIDIPDSAVLNALPEARAVFLAKYDRGSMFDLAVRAIVDGLYAQLAMESGDVPSP